MSIVNRLEKVIRDVPDFPKPGILFKDITPILQDPILCKDLVQELARPFIGKVDAVAGIESRGFLFGMGMAQALNVPFIPIRKKGKLPFHKFSVAYDLEYGSAEIEVHEDAAKKGDRILIHDDLLATGGTAAAAQQLIHKLGAEVVGYSFIINLTFLQGAGKLNAPVESILNI
ncbi:MAG: adenine phosphoribosyltransferase [Flavobacteriales bacterium]|jgi:adenine phosphoribosyltransferase